MTTHAMSTDTPNSGDAALRWIGDLDHPHYQDERNRYIWYEAQAIGFQFVGFASYFVAAISLLIVGKGALPYAAAMVAPFAISAIILKGYVARRGVDYWPQSMDFRRSRGLVPMAILFLLIAGLVRAFVGSEGGTSSIVGVLIGTAAAGIAIGIAGRLQKKNDAAAELLDD